ncbi:hypothetical protein [Streptomyces sp. NPDC056361]|uniref:hypothetical protein n=1 Tax=Streptomyces sp. NPDC056361 TaxID=3345795 RepID=UPI0035DB0A89
MATVDTPVAPAPEPSGPESRLGPIGRARASVAAIEILLRLREDQTAPSEEELRALRNWPGWGPLAPALAPDREGTWAEIGEQLQRLLTPREYRQAEQGTPTAYYTPDRIAQAAWSALRDLGFDGGRILEPGCGAGTFINHTPDGLDVRWFGVERDPTTAGIAALLHPDAEIMNARLQDAALQSNSVDAVLGNVPYGNFAVHDKTAPKAVTDSIHNYFIWRSVQAMRPGGVAILLTSRYTMDSQDDAARRAIAKHADLLGAIRLPNGALAEGGTGVLADILIVRRRDAEGPIDESWMGTSGVPGVSDQECNDYFLSHPEHVLGEWAEGRAPRYGHTLAVKAPEDQDLDAVLAEAFTSITTAARAAGREWNVAAAAQPWTLDSLPFPVREDGRKEGSFHLVDNKPHEVIDGELVAVERAGKELPKLIRLRDATLALIEAETNHDTPDEQLEPLREEVNRLYDAYARVHGPINRYTLAQGEVDEETGERAVSRRYPRLGGFRRDPDFVAVLALEDFDDETQTADKAPLLLRRVNKRIERPTSASSPEEALSLCLNFRNKVDVGVIAGLLSIEHDQVADALGELVFADPDTGELLTTGEYLSGPVVDKLERAEFLLGQGRDELQRHVDALREVQPEPLPPEDIKAKLGAPWIPVEDVKAFAEEMLGTGVEIIHVAKTATWNVDTPMTIPEAATSEWGTSRVNAFELLDLALNGQSPKVYDTFRTPEGGSKRVRNDKETLLAETKMADLARRFASWTWEDPDRAERLAADYNRIFNSTVLRKHDGSHLTVDGLDPNFNPYEHQWDFVQRVLTAEEGSLCPYPVGAGKTATMFMTALKLKQLGLVNKPMIVVPNHLLEQISRDGKKLFQGANILMAGKKDLADARSRMLFAARCATGDWDAIVMTHSSFGRLGVHPVTEATYLEELANAYREALSAVDGDDANQRRIKEIAKMVDRFDARASDLRSKATDAGVTYENLGVDFLQIDEAHLMKNLALPATTEGMALGKPSKRATDLDLKIITTRERTGQDNVVALYSGTFISNSVREMFVFKHYTMPKRLEKMGLASPDAWAANFIHFESRPEVGVDGVSFRLKRRPVEYTNADEAIAIFAEVAELRPKDSFKIKRPKRVDRFVEIEATPNLVSYVSGISDRIDRIQGGKVKPWEDNMLNVITDGRKAALDLELVGVTPDGPGKAGAIAENVLAVYERTKDLKLPDDPEGVAGGFQVVFCDLGTPSRQKGSQVYGKVRRLLIDGGVPRERIRFIHDYNSDLAKEQLFTDCRAGKVSVLFASTEKAGVGTNVQTRGVALHHADPPHKPAEWEQREGRLDRPGNGLIDLDMEVEFYRYLAKNSFDSFMFQQLERKQRPIVQILSGQKVGRVIQEIDPVGAGFGQAKAIVAGNPLLLEMAEVNGQLGVLLNAADGHRQAQSRMKRKVEVLDEQIVKAERSLSGIQTMADALTGASDDLWRTADGRLVDADDVPAALAQSAQGAKSRLDLSDGYRWRGIEVGFTFHRRQQFGGMAYESYAHLVAGDHEIDVRLNLSWFGKGQTWRIAKAIGEEADKAMAAPDELRQKVTKWQAQLEDTRSHIGRPFDRHAELEAVRERRAALEEAIAAGAADSGRENTGTGPQFEPGAAGTEMTEADMAMHDAAVMVGMMGGSAVVRSEGQIVGTVRRAPGPAPIDEPPRPHLENSDRFFEALRAVTDEGLADSDVVRWAQSDTDDSSFVGAFGEWTRAWVEQRYADASDRPDWVYAYLDDRAYASRDVLHGQAAAAVRQQARALADPAPDPAQTTTSAAADAAQQAEPAPEMVKIAAILRYYEPLFERHGLTGAAAAADYVTRPGYGYEPDPDNPLHDLAARIGEASNRALGVFRTGPNPNERVMYDVGRARQQAGNLLGDVSVSLVNLLTDTGEGYGAVDLDAILAAPPGTVVDLPPLNSTPPASRTAPEPAAAGQPEPEPQPAAAARRLTDPQLWDEGLRTLLDGAAGVERLEQAARANDAPNFAIVFADWAEDWLMDRHTGPSAGWPEWARRYFGAGEEAYQDREQLHAAAATALYDQLRAAAEPPAPGPVPAPAPAPAADATPAPGPAPLQSLIDGFGGRVMVGHISGPQAARTHQSAGWAIRAVLSEEQVLDLVSAVAVDGQPPSAAPDAVPTERVRDWIAEQQQAPAAAYYADTSSSLPPALRGNGEVQVSTNATGLTLNQRDVSTTILWEELPAWIDAAVAHDTATRSPSLPAWAYGRLDAEIHFRRDTETDARAGALDALYVALREGPPPSDEQLAASRDRYGPPPAPAAQDTDTTQTQTDPPAPVPAADAQPEPEPEPLPTEPVPGAEGYTYLETGRTVTLYDSTGEQVGIAKWSYTKYQHLGDVQGDTVRGTDEAAVVAKRMANHHAVVYGADVHRPALDDQGRDPVWILHNGSDTLVYGISPEDKTAVAALWTGGGFKQSRKVGGYYLPRTWKEPTRKGRVDTAVRVLAAAGRTVVVYARRDERQQAPAAPARLPVLDVTPPDLDQLPTFFDAPPYADEAEISQGVDRMTDAYGRWSEQPTVQAYIQQDYDARPDGFGTLDNPIAELRVAYARAEGALRGEAIGGADEILRRIYAVAAWSQALEPAVETELLDPLQELYAAAHMLAARTQATMAELARQAEQPAPAAEGAADQAAPETPEVQPEPVTGNDPQPAPGETPPEAPAQAGSGAEPGTTGEPAAGGPAEGGTPPSEASEAGEAASTAPGSGNASTPAPEAPPAAETAPAPAEAAETGWGFVDGESIQYTGQGDGRYAVTLPGATYLLYMPSVEYRRTKYSVARDDAPVGQSPRRLRTFDDPTEIVPWLRNHASREQTGYTFRDGAWAETPAQDEPAPTEQPEEDGQLGLFGTPQDAPGPQPPQTNTTAQPDPSPAVQTPPAPAPATSVPSAAPEVTPPPADEDAPGPVVSDEFSVLYAAYQGLVARSAGTGDPARFTLGRNGVLADPDTVHRLMDSGLLEHAEETTASITPAGRYHLAALAEAGRDEPGVGDRVLLVSTGLVGVVGGYETTGQGVRRAEVVFDREGWPDGWDLAVGPLYLTTLDPAVMDAEEAAQRYRRASLRQFAGTLTDPTLRDDARAAFVRAALASPELARAAQEGHPDDFVPAVASWMSQWATQQWADVPEDEQPAWVSTFFRASDDAVSDRNGLYVDVAAAIRSDLRQRPREGLEVEGRRLAPRWFEYTIEGQTYRAALLPDELSRGRLGTLSTVIVDERNELVGRSFGLPSDGEMRWIHTNPGVPSPSVMGWLRLGGEVMWPPYSAEERTHMQAGPPAEQMSFDLGAGPSEEPPAEEEDEDLVDTTENGDEDDPEYEVSVPGEDTRTTAPPEPVVTPDPVDPQATNTEGDAEQQDTASAATDGPASDTPAPEPVRGPMLTLGLREGPEGQIVARVEAGDGVHALVLPGISTADVPGLALPVTVETPMLTRSAQLAEQLISDDETEAWLGEHLPTGPLAAAWSSDRVRAVLIVVVRDSLRDDMAPSVDDVATWLVGASVENEGLLRVAHTAGPEGFGPAFATAADSLIADGGSEHLLWTYLGGDGTRRAEVLSLATPEAYAQLLALPAPTESQQDAPQESEMATPARPEEPARADSATPAPPAPPTPEPAPEASPAAQQDPAVDFEVEEPPEPQRRTTFFDLPNYDGHRVFLSGWDGMADDAGELRREGPVIATLHRTEGGWYARMQLDTPDLTPLVTHPETAAEQAAVMYAAFTGAPLGEPVVAAPGSDVQARAEQMRSELREFAALHTPSIEIAARHRSYAYSTNPHYIELTARLADVADAEGRGARMMAADLAGVERAVTQWGASLPPSPNSEYRVAMAFPLAHLLFDVRRLQARLQATVEVAAAEAAAERTRQPEAAATAEPAPPEPETVADGAPSAEGPSVPAADAVADAAVTEDGGPSAAAAVPEPPAAAADPGEGPGPEAELSSEPLAEAYLAAEDGGSTVEPELQAAPDVPVAPLGDGEPADAPSAEDAVAAVPADEAGVPAEEDVAAALAGEPTEAPDVPEVAMPSEDPPLAAPAAAAPDPEPAAPLWGTDDVPVAAYAAGEDGREERPDAAGADDILTGFQGFREAWDDAVTTGVTSADLFDDVQGDLITLRTLLAEAVDGTPAPEPAAPPAEPDPAAEQRDEHREAEAVNESLREADTHAESLQDLPEWQKIQTVRGAMGHLLTTIRKRAGEEFDKLLGDKRAIGFLREWSARACDKIAGLAQAAARKLRGEDGRADERGGALPSAEALLRLGDAATTFSDSRRGPGGTPPPSGSASDLPDIPAMRKMGEALAKPMPGARPKVSAAAARGRSTTVKRSPVKKPGTDKTTEQAGHLRRGPDKPQPRKPQR